MLNLGTQFGIIIKTILTTIIVNILITILVTRPQIRLLLRSAVNTLEYLELYWVGILKFINQCRWVVLANGVSQRIVICASLLAYSALQTR